MVHRSAVRVRVVEKQAKSAPVSIQVGVQLGVRPTNEEEEHQVYFVLHRRSLTRAGKTSKKSACTTIRPQRTLVKARRQLRRQDGSQDIGHKVPQANQSSQSYCHRVWHPLEPSCFKTIKLAVINREGSDTDLANCSWYSLLNESRKGCASTTRPDLTCRWSSADAWTERDWMSRSSNTLPSRLVGDALCEACPIDLVDTSMYLRLYRAGLLSTNFGKLVTERPRFLRFLLQYQHIDQLLSCSLCVWSEFASTKRIQFWSLCFLRVGKDTRREAYLVRTTAGSVIIRKRCWDIRKNPIFEIESDTTFRTV
jgi:hypothetical protein